MDLRRRRRSSLLLLSPLQWGQRRTTLLQTYFCCASLALLFGLLDERRLLVQGESSPPVADVEDLFKDEGFLRMSRGGEAFGGRRPPPPPLILGPPHLFTTQQPSQSPQTSRSPLFLPTVKPKTISTIKPNQNNNNNNNQGLLDPSNNNNAINDPKSEGGGDGSSSSSSSSDAHPLLGITPAAPGEAFDFNPILSNPAVTRILAGSSGRIPQWEPTLPDLHDLIPEVNNYTATTTSDRKRERQNNGGSGNNGPKPHSPSNPVVVPIPTPLPSPGIIGFPTRPVFIPSPVSSKISPTIYNMDQLTNNIAIPKHVLPNPSNLATSRTTTVVEENNEESEGSNRDEHSQNHHHHEDNHHDNHHQERYNGGSSGRDTSNNGEGESPYMTYDDGDDGNRGSPNEEGRSSDSSLSPNNNNNNNGEGPKYIVCDALCGAWKHQCKLMGILFSITGVLCILLSIVVLHSLHFSFRDFAPFSVILLFLFTASISRAFILLGGWFCSPEGKERPSWLPIVSTLPATFFVVSFLVTLYLARFPFPFVKEWNSTIPPYVILVISLGSMGLPVSLAVGSHLNYGSQQQLAQGAWIAAHLMLLLLSLVYLFKFKSFYARLSSERGLRNHHHGNGTLSSANGQSVGGDPNSSVNTLGSSNLKNNGGPTNGTNGKRNLALKKWGCLQARAMFGAALLALTLSTMIIISVSMSRGECEKSSTWTGWVLSLCARMIEFAIVILLLVVAVFSVDVRFLSRLTRVSINKTNVGLINGDIYPTMVSANTAVQRCIPMYSSNNARADVMLLGPTAESRSSLRGKTFGERALPGERLGEYRSSVGRGGGLPLRLGNSGASPHSMPGTPVDGFPQGLKLPEPAPASLLVTKVVFGKPVSRELSHHENPMLLCANQGGGGSKGGDQDPSNNIYASLESVKMMNPYQAPDNNPNANQGDSSTGGSNNSSGSDRVLLSGTPRDYIYSISRDLTKTIDSIYDANHRSRGDAYCPPLAHTIDAQLGSASISNLNMCGSHTTARYNFNHGHGHPHHPYPNQSRTDLARTIERIRYAASSSSGSQQPPPPPPPHQHHGSSSSSTAHIPNSRNFVLQLTGNHNPSVPNPPPYCSSESSHDVTPDSGIVADIHSKSGGGGVYSRDYSKRSSEDVRRLPHLPLQKHRTPGTTPLFTPTSPSGPSSASTPSSNGPLYNGGNQNPPMMVGRVEHLLNQTEHILSRTESLDSNSQSAGLQRLLSHKEQLATVERLLAQAEYAIWLEKRTAQLSGGEVNSSPYGYAHVPPPFPSANSTNSNCNAKQHPPDITQTTEAKTKQIKSSSKQLEEESVV